MERHILTAVLWLPALGALLLGFVPRGKEDLIRRGALFFSLLTFGLSLLLLQGFDHSVDATFQFVTEVPWIPQFGIEYKTGVDGISLVLLVLTTLLSWIAILSSWTSITERVKEYYIVLLLLQTGMTGVFVTLDLILFYLFWEAMLVPMYFLIGVWGGERKLYATIKFLIYTLVGSLLMLLAIIYLHLATKTPATTAGAPGLAGTFDFEYILQHRAGIIDLLLGSAPMWAFLAFALAFAIKVPVWPFHTWLPDAHVEAPTAGSVVLAGVLLKMGTYGLVRFCLPLFPAQSMQFMKLGLWLGVIGIIYGAVVAFAQRDVKKLVAYSSVSHMGFVLLGIFAFTQTGVEGAVLQMLNHGLSTGALFLIVGMIYERRHTREIAAFGGLWKVMPVFAALFLVTTLSSVGLPGLNGFIGEFMCLLGTWIAGHKMMTALGATGVILGAVYMLWMFQRVMQGPLDKPENETLRDLNGREFVCLAPLVVLMFWIGVWPNSVLRLFDESVSKNVLRPIGIHRQANPPRPLRPTASPADDSSVSPPAVVPAPIPTTPRGGGTSAPSATPPPGLRLPPLSQPGPRGERGAQERGR